MVRPLKMVEVPGCEKCENLYGRDAFPENTKFKSDNKKKQNGGE